MANVSFIQADQLEHKYLQGEQLLAAGKLMEAAALCQQLLAEDSRYPRGYFLLSRIYAAAGNMLKALEFIDRAIDLSDNPNCDFHYMRGSYLLSQGQFDAAESDLKKAFEANAAHGLAAIMLATVYIHQKNYSEAKRFLEIAKKLGRHAEALSLEGVLLRSAGKNEEALNIYAELIKLHPTNPSKYFQRGEIFLVLDRLDEALEDAKAGLALNSRSEENWRLSGQVHSRQGNCIHAINAFEAALALKPNSLQLWQMLGRESMHFGMMDKAREAYLNLIKFDPENAEAISVLPYLLMLCKQTEEAYFYLEKALQKNPLDPMLNHIRACLTEEKIESAGGDYIAAIYDQYAQNYDLHHQQLFEYKTPELLANALEKTIHSEGGILNNLSLLDLGCGTGLSAEALKKFTQHRVGVDLSEKMIDKARQRNLYDELHVTGIHSYLNDCSKTFDVISAVDVLVYVGNLEPIFETARKTLNDSGKFIFSVEVADGDVKDYALNNFGRFVHTREYLEKIAAVCRYKVVSLEDKLLRFQSGKHVSGFITVFTKIRMYLAGFIFPELECL